MIRFLTTLTAVMTATFLAVAFVAPGAHAQYRGDLPYQTLCGAEKHPEWAFGDDTFEIDLRPLFGCDDRVDFQHARDEEYIEKLVKLGYGGPQLGDLLSEQGWVWLKKHKPDLAMRRFNLAFAHDPWNGDIYHGIALALVESGQPDNVVGYWFGLATAQAKGSAQRFIDHGRFLTISGQFEKALPVLERAHTMQPDHTFTLMNLAHGYFETGRKPEACTTVDKLTVASAPEGYPADRFALVVSRWQERAVATGC
ncbi:tetratricopeptide repeat protein [Minwuia sp.]|uniref:tetratricopeptide repeat protein n=1 Tax=Minwuia sp. TaxID=2493630 RepID=UPI003A8D8810